MNRISLWDAPLVGLLSIIRERIMDGESDAAVESVNSLIILIEGIGEV